ncbi:NepR family anti-sigma factor [Microvirga sp. P5_D2]
MNKTENCQLTSRTGFLHTDPRTVSAIRDKLGEQLRAMYGRLEEEPLPDRLRDLMRQLGQPHSRGKP